MNKLQRDIRLRIGGQMAVAGSFVGLGMFKLAQVLTGLKEQELYKRYPVTWWIAVILGFIFIAALFYSVKKTMDIHPNIQLRSKSDSILKQVLADPEYALWHDEAQRLLNQRDHKRTQQGGPAYPPQGVGSADP